MDAAKQAKSSFLQFQYKIYFIVVTTDNHLFWLLRIKYSNKLSIYHLVASHSVTIKVPELTVLQ
jgi:hypothetical protein